MKAWNSRYVAYARAHGRTPDEQVDADRREWPGGVMAGFMLWISARWSEWRRLTGRSFPASADDHREFDTWLDSEPRGGS